MAFHIYTLVDDDNERGMLNTQQFGFENRFDSYSDAFNAAKNIAKYMGSHVVIGSNISVLDANKTITVKSEEEWNRGLR